MKVSFFLSIFSLIIVSAFSQYAEGPDTYKARNIPLKNITELASPLLEKYDVKFYWLDLEVDNQSTYITGNVTIGAEVMVSELDSFVVELIDEMAVDSVLFNNTIQAFNHVGDLITILPDNPVPVGEWFEVKIYYHGVPVGTGVGNASQSSGLFPYVTWTLSEPFSAKEWFPVKEDLTDKADSAYIFLTTPDHLKAGSNGMLTKVDTLPGNKLRHEWKTYYPIDFYLLSFSVSEYSEINFYAHPAGLQDSVLIQNYVYTTLPFLLEDIYETDEQLELFSELFGMYPFANEKYGHCHAPIGGGMEHQTMTTAGYFTFWLVAHELAHMWFGDYVTCATWQDIWINEGFASYSEYIAYQMMTSQTDADEWMTTAHTYAMDMPEGSVYIPINEVNSVARIFSYELTYKKGGSLVHMMRFELDNDSLFFHVLREHLATYANSTATGLDFKTVLEAESGRSFDTFFDQWYFGKGFPTFGGVFWNDNGTLHFDVEQTTSSLETPLFVTPMEYRINYASGSDTVVRVMHDELFESYTIPVPEDVISIEIDPFNWILNAENGMVNITDNPEIAVANSNINIYPNPCSDIITIRLSNDDLEKNIQINDATGRIIKEFRTNGVIEKIDLSGLESGIYFLHIQSDNGRFVKQIVKQ